MEMLFETFKSRGRAKPTAQNVILLTGPCRHIALQGFGGPRKKARDRLSPNVFGGDLSKPRQARSPREKPRARPTRTETRLPAERDQGDREPRRPAPRERRGPSEPAPEKQWRERDVGRGRRRRAGKGLRRGRARERIRARAGGPEERDAPGGRQGPRGRALSRASSPARSLAARPLQSPSRPPRVPPHSPAPPHRSNPSAQLPQPPRRAPSPPPPPRRRPLLAPGQGPALCSVLGLCRKSRPRRCSLEGGPASAPHGARGTSQHRTPVLLSSGVMHVKNPTISLGEAPLGVLPAPFSRGLATPPPPKALG
ncbi:uncharacterized protein LOC121824305 [Peromyscus maniculatus bairdii]|uniref:uncharacterized protein LOC121824305 n=1 Tax=Peromyscus maniculatus bairdii TaxID=230844 RepID=UPI003FD44677